MKRFRDIEIGQAKGLSSHSSIQEGLSSMLYKSNELDLSPIIKQSQSSYEVSDQNIYPEFMNRCKFCGNPERSNHKLIKVCGCIKSWGHEICVKNHKQIEPACKTCAKEWTLEIHRENQTQRKNEYILDSLDEISEKHKSSQLNSNSYNIYRDKQFRIRMRAETTKAICRYCGGSSDTLDDKLIFPCQCHALDSKESWAHRKCIFDYLVNTQRVTCEKCKTKFAFGYDRVRIWICQDSKRLNEFVSKICSLGVLLLGLIGILVFLIDNDVMDYTYSELVWNWILVALLLICIAIAFLVLVFISLETFYIKEFKNIQVLCQKHEIAKMRAKSDEVFHRYLQDLEEKNLLPSAVTNTPRKHYFKGKNEFIESIEEEEKNEFRDNAGNGERSRTESETVGENIESEILKEHSNIKESQVVLQILESSDDYQAELQEMSEKKHSVRKCLSLKE